MQVKIGDIAASCPLCDATEFISQGPESPRDAKLACASCGHETSRAALLVQIGDKAARQAAESLARLRQQRLGGDRQPRS